MADHLTEEEQVEALKRWWNENWLSVVLPIALAIAGYLGWNAWQNHQHANAQAASDQFQAMTRAAEVAPGQALAPEQKAKVAQMAESLVSEHSATLYADMANMLLAKLHVEDNQLDLAEARLRKVVSEGSNDSMKQVATARLARVLNAKGDHDAALALVGQATADSYKALFAEIRGDIYQSQGKVREANTAYNAALQALPPSEFSRRSLLQLKLDAVAVPAVETAAEEGDA